MLSVWKEEIFLRSCACLSSLLLYIPWLVRETENKQPELPEWVTRYRKRISEQAGSPLAESEALQSSRGHSGALRDVQQPDGHPPCLPLNYPWLITRLRDPHGLWAPMLKG